MSRGGRLPTRIVVAVDGSGEARQALLSAVELARLVDGSVVAIHVATPVAPSSFDTPRAALRADEAARRAGEQILADARRLAGDVLAARELHFGDPAAAICRRAGELDADLIAVGSRGLGRVERLLLGSVSAVVGAQAPCSVLIVRGRAGRVQRSPRGRA